MGIMYKLMKHRNLSTDLSNSHTHVNVKSDRNRLITIEGNIVENTESVSEDSSSAAAEALSNNKNMDSNLDKQFTAEHIIQLCKFLAEKSKRNKNLYKQQQSPKKLTKSKQSQFQFQTMEEYNDNDDDDEIDFYQNEALPLLNKQRLVEQQQQRNHSDDDAEDVDDVFEEEKPSTVLSTRLSPDINSLNISSNTTTTATSCALQYHQQQQQQHQQSFNYQQQQHHHLQQQQQYQHPPQNQGKRDILLKIRRQIFERKRLRENGAFEPQALNNSQVWRPW